MGADVKAPARECRGCDKEIPPQEYGPGRPRVFCSRDCRSKYHRRNEQDQIDRERAEEKEQRRFEYEQYHYGTRAAKQMASDRARVREERA